MVSEKKTIDSQIEEFIALNKLQVPTEEPEEKTKEKTEDEKAIEEYEKMVAETSFFKRKDVKWLNIYLFVVLHLVALYGFIRFPYRERWATFLWGWFLVIVANIGVTAGVHRLWAHKSYKAKTPLRIILLVCYLVSGQYSVLYWSRDHRIHHKFSETRADPVNASRGFWFSHVGWLTMKRHPAVLQKAKVVDMSDVLADPVVQFGEKYFEILRLIIGFMIPLFVPIYFWNESWYWAIISQVFMRYAYSLNCTWGVNSFAHMFGSHPYDNKIAPAENFMMSLTTGGEGWHNYHHTFPADYKVSEYGKYITNMNITTYLIDFWAKIGWAYDLKQPTEELVRATIQNRGDGTHLLCNSKETKTN